MTDTLDWTHLRAFLAVADEGSLTAASRRLGQSQPTTGRQIKAMETSLGAELFHRNLRGLELTEFGLSLIEHARQMAFAAAKIERVAQGNAERLRGTVRITASVVVAHYLLPPIIADMRLAEPDIQIELVSSDLTESLSFREADIAVRMYRPTQLDCITKHIGDQKMALYAANSLLQRLGQPGTQTQLLSLPFVGFDTSDYIIRAMRELGVHTNKEFFGVRCDDQAAYWRLVCAGCGIGAMQVPIGDCEPRVTRLSVQPALPPLPMWLAAPDAMRRNRKIKRIWELLEAALNV